MSDIIDPDMPGLQVVDDDEYADECNAAIAAALLAGSFFVLDGLKYRAYLKRVDVVKPTASPWAQVYAQANDQAFLDLMGFTVKEFEFLRSVFEPKLHEHRATKGRQNGRRPYNRTSKLRPNELDGKDSLALALHWIHCIAEQKILGLVFGILQPTVSRILWEALEVLDVLLVTVDDARIVWPDAAKKEEFRDLIVARQPLLAEHNPFLFMDGLNLPIPDPTDEDKQRAYYNGWLHGCFVSNVIVWGPDGTMAWFGYNMPGSWHDVSVSRAVLDKLLEEEKHKMIADSAWSFKKNAVLASKFLVPLKSGALDKIHDERVARKMLALHKAVVSIRQAAEWGMRDFQSFARRLTVPLPTDSRRRAVLLRVAARLFNFRVRRVGISQIRTVYSRDYVPGGFTADITSTDHLARYYNLV